MFKKTIKNMINLLTHLQKSLNNAYDETYSDLELTKELNKEIKIRQQKNKKEFVTNIALLTMMSAHSDGYPMQFDEAIIIAENMFLKAIQRGDVDELYSLKDKKRS